MDRKPRSTKESLVNPGLMLKSLFQGLTIFAAAFGAYLYLIKQAETVETARTLTLLILGIANLFLVYVNQSEKGTAFTGIFKLKDRVIWYVNMGIIIALALVIYLPAGNAIAKTVPLNAYQVLIAIALAAAATFWWEIVKVFKRAGLKTIDMEIQNKIGG